MSQTMPAATKKIECFSMTGYAQARAEQDGWAVRVSVKSVNHRFLDLKLRMPEGFDLYDLRLRQIVREKIHRGHVEVTVGVEPGKAAPVQVNKELVQSYLKAAEALRQETRAATETEEEQERLGRVLESGLRDALAKLDDMRRAEGRHLVEELRDRLARIVGHVEQVRGLAATLRPAFARRLETRLKELLGGIGIDPGRLAQEAALLAERSDISEELDRLKSHLQQFTKLLDGAGELGKKLDFLLQEMHREANTMLSKTPGVESEALAITGVALEIKAEIEKLREQVQNIE